MFSRIIVILLISVQLLSADDKKCHNDAKCMIVEDCVNIYSSLKQFERTYLIKLIQRLHCGYDEENRPKICCPPNFEVPHESINSGQLNINEALALLPSKTVCGLDIRDKIVGGQVTNIDEHPWMAIIFRVTPTNTTFHCGGVLISSRYIMTAAHCFKSDDDINTVYKVRLGEWQLSSKIDCLSDECSPDPVDVDVEEVIPHENHSILGHNDIALLRLARNVPFTEFVKPICLPVDTKFKENTFQNYNLEVAGWGLTGDDDIYSDFKLKVRIPVSNSQQCHLVYKRYNITENQICAGGLRGQDSCKGDSGGPLMGQIDSENWMAIGVVSFGSYPCGRPGWPGVYTRVTSYIDWILSKIRP